MKKDDLPPQIAPPASFVRFLGAGLAREGARAVQGTGFAGVRRGKPALTESLPNHYVTICSMRAGLPANPLTPVFQLKLAKCACIRAASAWRPLNSSNAFTAWNTAMLLPSSVRQPSARAARSSSVSSGK